MDVTVKIIVINSEARLLALRRSATDPGRPLTWDLPGGVLEHGEILEEAIKRETLEEAGIKIERVTIHDAASNVSERGEYWIQICYLTTVEMPEVVLSYEHDQYEWVTKDEFLSRESTERIKRFLTKIEI